MRPRRRTLLTTLGAALTATLLANGCTTSEPAPVPGITESAVQDSFGELDRIVEEAMERTGVPGVAVAVVYDDEVVYEQAYGVRSTETGEPVTTDTVFQIASLSKPVSSTIMAGLVGQGVFEWDDPIDGYTDLTLSDPWVSEHVTFADLFAHRSGIPGAVGGNDLESVGYDRDEIMQRMRYLPLNPFRITYSYSNFGMTMAGEAAAEAAGKSWEETADEVLFDPLGMAHTSMRHSDFETADNTAALHVEQDGQWVPAFERQPDAQAPAGGVSSTVGDLASWLRLQLADGQFDGQQVVDADALAETHTPQVLKTPPDPESQRSGFYGLGWNIETDDAGMVRWNHSGAFSTGAATTAKLIPAEEVGIVVLTNGQPIGVPEAITDAYLEYLQTGEVGTDYVELWGERFGGLYGAPLELPDKTGAPAGPTSQYVGTYANEYVGEVTFGEKADGGLEMIAGPADNPVTFPLEHYDGNTFVYLHYPETPEYPELVIFEVADGTAESVELTAFDGAGLGTLQRVG